MKDWFDEIVLEPIRRSMTDHADRDAFFIAGQTYSYRQFGTSVAHMREQMCQTQDGICALEIRDDLETYATIVALWMEGKAFVPLNPNHPKERNERIINLLESNEHNRYKDPLAYVLFTSGSTGVPKGVAISRNNVAAFMDSFWKTGIRVAEEDRCLQCFDLTFDVAIQSFLVALTRGACVCTVPYGQVKYLQVASLIHMHHVTFAAMAPSMLSYLRPYFPEMDASSLKTCILTAEACPVDLIDAWFECAKNAKIYDFYGPTEATVYCTYYPCAHGRNLATHGIVSIGKPLAHVLAVIIGEDGKERCDAGQKGELCLSGAQITQGYWEKPEKNKSAFFEMEKNGVSHRFYRTGDLCYWDVSGNLMYEGRIDHQAKIQGFRVELGEIEYHARTFYDAQYRVAAVAFQNEQQVTEIALFVEKGEEPTDSLLKYLREKMPPYMIPGRIVFLPAFPMNSNEKIDRAKLKDSL